LRRVGDVHPDDLAAVTLEDGPTSLVPDDFEELREERPVEQDGVASPARVARGDNRTPGGEVSPDQLLHGGSCQIGLVAHADDGGGGIIRQGADPAGESPTLALLEVGVDDEAY
jgi:hypothetical protein